MYASAGMVAGAPAGLPEPRGPPSPIPMPGGPVAAAAAAAAPVAADPGPPNITYSTVAAASATVHTSWLFEN